jgi:hypothetical protein
VQIAHRGDKSGALERRELVAQVGDAVNDFHACDLRWQFKKSDYTSVEAPSSPTCKAQPGLPGRRHSAPFLRARGSVTLQTLEATSVRTISLPSVNSIDRKPLLLDRLHIGLHGALHAV